MLFNIIYEATEVLDMFAQQIVWCVRWGNNKS